MSFMRKVVAGFAAALLLLAAGCGTAGETSSTVPSETPDAVSVATDEPSSVASPEVTGSGAAEVVVDGAGFSLGDYEEVGYGLVLKNTSTTMDASSVQITVNLLDKSGVILTTENSTLSLVPAGGTFYFGNSAYVSKGDRPKKMEAFVDVGTSEPAKYALPKVANVRVIRDPDIGVRVKGQVKNDLDGTLSQLAWVGCVLFDANGKVVGGGFTFLDASLPSGRTAAFEIGNGTGATPSGKVARAAVSMDNQVE